MGNATSKDEDATTAINYWTDSGYNNIRNGESVLRGDKTVEQIVNEKSVHGGKDLTKYVESQVKYAKQFNETLDKAPKFDGEVYRGMRISEDSKYYSDYTTVGNEFEFTGSQSSSRSNEKAASSFSGGKMLMHIKQSNGALIEELSGLSSEKEVVLRHGTKYRVTAVYKNVKVGKAHTVRTYVQAEEIK